MVVSEIELCSIFKVCSPPLSVIVLACTIILYRAEIFDEFTSDTALNPELDWSFYLSKYQAAKYSFLNVTN